MKMTFSPDPEARAVLYRREPLFLSKRCSDDSDPGRLSALDQPSGGAVPHELPIGTFRQREMPVGLTVTIFSTTLDDRTIPGRRLCCLPELRLSGPIDRDVGLARGQEVKAGYCPRYVGCSAWVTMKCATSFLEIVPTFIPFSRAVNTRYLPVSGPSVNRPGRMISHRE